jgi:hypothetical protein
VITGNEDSCPRVSSGPIEPSLGIFTSLTLVRYEVADIRK